MYIWDRIRNGTISDDEWGYLSGLDWVCMSRFRCLIDVSFIHWHWFSPECIDKVCHQNTLIMSVSRIHSWCLQNTITIDWLHTMYVMIGNKYTMDMIYLDYLIRLGTHYISYYILICTILVWYPYSIVCMIQFHFWLYWCNEWHPMALVHELFRVIHIHWHTLFTDM